MGKKSKKSKELEYTTTIEDSGDPYYSNRILVGTATTGLVRVEWIQARMGQTIPMNWSQVTASEWMSGYMPLRFQVADAQNLICKRAIENDFQWLFLYEHDVIPPPDALMKINKYMRDEKYPVVSGLYYSRSRPSEPLLFRGRGDSVFTDFKMGDIVWVSGVPTGFLLVHMNLIRLMWNESPEYVVKNQVVRRVFETPRYTHFDPAKNRYSTMEGTSDLHWSQRIIDNNYLAKAGWKKLANKKYPFLVDTSIFCKHINPDGEMFP